MESSLAKLLFTFFGPVLRFLKYPLAAIVLLLSMGTSEELHPRMIVQLLAQSLFLPALIGVPYVYFIERFVCMRIVGYIERGMLMKFFILTSIAVGAYTIVNIPVLYVTSGSAGLSMILFFLVLALTGGVHHM
jgi:hypothetical protein